MLQFHNKIVLNVFWQEKWQETEWMKILRTDSVQKSLTCIQDSISNEKYFLYKQYFFKFEKKIKLFSL